MPPPKRRPPSQPEAEGEPEEPQKAEAKKWLGMSREALFLLGGAGALALLSVLFLGLAVRKYVVRSSFTEAMRLHESGRRVQAQDPLETTLSWAWSHSGAREMMAKLAVEAGRFSEAESHYQKLLPRTAARCSLGVIALRMAEAATDTKTFEEHLKTAEEHFGEALASDEESVEAQVGVATAKLMAAARSGDEGRVARLKEDFLKILKQVQEGGDAARDTTREAYADLFAGLGRTHYAAGNISEAAAYFGSCAAYHPDSVAVQANLLYLEARRIAETPSTPDLVKNAKWVERISGLQNRIAVLKDLEPLSEPLLQYGVAAYMAAARAGDMATASKILAQIDMRYRDRLLARLVDGAVKLNHAARAPAKTNERRSAFNLAHAAYQKMSAHRDLEDPARAEWRAVVWNNMGFLEEEMAVTGGGETWYQRAVTSLMKALEADKQAGSPEGTYEVLRNLAVIQKRRGKPEAQGHFEAAVKAAEARSEAWVKEDMDNLRKYFAGELKD
ncbi:MAG: hypothetical protein HY716_06880 [Planctomycetes bacterium]|nr:hypothetical protein [Planctomycetota bacterium]